VEIATNSRHERYYLRQPIIMSFPPSFPDFKSSTSTSRSLLRQLQSNDPEAWNRLIKLYAPLVWDWCRKMGLASQDCADVFQEVFGTVARKYHTFHKDRPHHTFRGWLRTITRNKVLDLFRKQRHEPQGIGGTAAKAWLCAIPDVMNDGADAEHAFPTDCPLFQAALLLIQENFEQTTWQAFWAVVVEGRTPHEVALTLGISPAAVRVAKCRVLQRLRQELGDVME
jgi:RNA polymerase sigma-70 factor (ECF subfamily)